MSEWDYLNKEAKDKDLDKLLKFTMMLMIVRSCRK